LFAIPLHKTINKTIFVIDNPIKLPIYQT